MTAELAQLRNELTQKLDHIQELLVDTINRDPGKIMTTEEVAEFCSVSRREVLRWKESGLPCYAMGKGFRFKREDVEAFRERFKT